MRRELNAADGPKQEIPPKASHSVAAGHLEVRIEGEHPQEVPFLFERTTKRAPGAAVSSAVVHLVGVALIVVGVGYAPRAARPDGQQARVEPREVVWLVQPGPGGGGGGGGDGTRGPIRRIEMPGKDNVTVPVAKPKPVVITPQVASKEPPAPPAPDIAQLDIAALASAHGSETLNGTLDGLPGGTSAGPGSGPGAGNGNGRGIGGGIGDGLGDGTERGSGGGPYQRGAGIEEPKLIYAPKPEYTNGAMQAKIQGIAVVECIVMPDGTVSRPRIVRSIDSRFGLDEQAVKTASKFRFIPARRAGHPVPMLVEIHVEFSLL